MGALSHQVQVVVAQGRRKAEWIFDLELLSLVIDHPQSIGKRGVMSRKHSLEEAFGVHQIHWPPLVRAIGWDNRHPPGVREEGPHNHGAPGSLADLMRAKQCEGISVLTSDDRFYLFSGKRCRHRIHPWWLRSVLLDNEAAQREREYRDARRSLESASVGSTQNH